METTENTNETTPDSTPPATEAQASEVQAPETQAQAPEAPEEDPNSLGKLTPEEQAALMLIRQQTQQLLAKVGEHEVLKQRLLAKLDELDQQGQGHINGISKRIGVEDGRQWVALQDGTIRLVNNPGNAPAPTPAPTPAPAPTPDGGGNASG